MRGVSFAGNRAIDDYTLRMSIATSRSSWQQRIFFLHWLGGEKRYFDETEFRRDVLRLGVLYRQSGFFESKIDTLVRRGTDDVSVRFLITEGAPVLVTSVTVTGVDDIVPNRELLAELPLRPGDPFSRYALQASADSIRSVLQNRGYPHVEVFRSYDEDRPGRSAQVRFEVDPGARARIGQISVTGAQRVAPKVVERVTGLHTGDLYRRDALARTQIRLYRTDLFSHVSVDLVDTAGASATDSIVAVRIEVGEGKFYGTRAGGGYGALDCFRGLTGFTARNFLGGGRSLDLTGRLSKLGCIGVTDADSTWLKLNYNATVSLRQPSFPTPRTSTAASFFAERRSELNTYVRTAHGGELSVSAEIAWQTALTLSYGLALGRTVADPAIFCSLQNVCSTADAAFTGPRVESAVGFSLFHDGSNSPLDPSRGRAVSLQGRYSSPSIGSDTLSQFAKGVFDFSSYHRLGRRGVFAWRVRVGGILPTELGFTARRATYVPPDERLYAGGPNTVRGYGQNLLGPIVRVQVVARDTAGNVLRKSPTDTLPLDSTMRAAPTGGTRMVVGNVELRAPMPIFSGRLSWAAFLDVGQVYDPEQPAAERTLRLTPGLGLRLSTPLGPVRVDVAYRPYDPTPGPLYEAANGQLTEIYSSYVPPPATSRLGRLGRHLQLNLSVGQAF